MLEETYRSSEVVDHVSMEVPKSSWVGVMFHVAVGFWWAVFCSFCLRRRALFNKVSLETLERDILPFTEGLDSQTNCLHYALRAEAKPEASGLRHEGRAQKS